MGKTLNLKLLPMELGSAFHGSNQPMIVYDCVNKRQFGRRGSVRGLKSTIKI